ncbi:cytochrome c oxidase assembly protein [Limoniibacter endophyticus]|uniref:Cytochrome c oxidase assembly factor CtaG n=1 Tax=Limoniibacter endophyticus TaxID=1565040 RepID=A0A8J3GGE0_9HYPH|nr:cytochrome c oxidase assembly protein [Limoniibacter endophyticus]GHC72430.1 hypothetical protein GCM10010136_20130 [Limoniibacter endophyticus]
MNGGVYDPYCGTPPDPADLFVQWNFDPILIIFITLTGWILYRRAPTARKKTYGSLALALLLVAFVSPLCALTSSLFSARATHHLLVTSLLAPCIVFALGNAPLFSRIKTPLLSSAFFLVVLWAWHLPVVYDFALSGTWQYWLMQLLLILASLFLWNDLLSVRETGMAAVVALFAATQMALLGALLTFASRPLFAAHFLTTESYGLSPLTDQQLAGLIMWVPSALPFLLVAVLKLMQLLTCAATPAGRA